VHPDLVVDEGRSAAWPGEPAPDVSVVVPTCNRAGFLGDLVAALERQRMAPERFEVLIVDDASSDGTWEELTAYLGGTSLRMRALRHGANTGQGTARTTGLCAARGAVVAFTDDDCIPTPPWLERLTAPLLAAGDGSRAPVVVQGRTVPWPDDEASAGAWSRTVWVLGPTWLFETCNVAYRRDDLVRVGGFPARGDAPVGPHGRLVGEDALVGWQVLDGGAQLQFVPEALVHHRHLPARYLDWLAEQRGRGVFPALVARSPHGRRALWHRWFLARRTAAFDLALVTAAAAAVSGRARWLVGCVPWVLVALPEAADRRGRHPALRLGQLALGDAVGFASLVAGSVRHRCLVL